MTRDHAKKILTHLRNGKSDLMLMDALDMAISALSEHKPRTNGGAIISLYPDLKYTIQNGRVITTFGVASSFDLDWWNAPYKAEREE